MTPFQHEVYNLLTYHWQTKQALQAKLEAKGYRGLVFGHVDAALRVLEHMKLVEKKWATEKPTAEDIEERGGARNRVYRKVADGTREHITVPGNLQPSLA